MKSRFYIIIIFSILVITVSYVITLKKEGLGTAEKRATQANQTSLNTPNTATPGAPGNFREIPSVKKIDNSALPPGFPSIPLNGKEEIANSYIVQYGASNNDQKVVDFTSAKSVKENFDFYKKWTTEHNWKIFNEIQRPNESRLIIQKDKTFLNIVIQRDSIAGSNINMSY